jgi:glycosyltransferase involved in cell wall biosynthesis
MYLDNTISVVVPCKNEETQIASVIDSMPAFVDSIIVVDDGSDDDTGGVTLRTAASDSRVKLISHETCQGVGAAIATGYAHARDEAFDITVVMAGDGQMDPDDLELVVYPVAAGVADYCKGNRFNYTDGFKKIPTTRKVGNFVLSVMTKLVSGYWHVSDSQTGYTAISLGALEAIDVESIYPSYGCPNDILVKLNIADMRVAEVPVNPLYDVGEQSKMKIFRVILPISTLLARGFLSRMFRKHVVRSAHPVVLAFAATSVCFSLLLLMAGRVLTIRLWTGEIPMASLIACGIASVVSLQFLLTAFSMDFEANRHLYAEIDREKMRSLRPRKSFRRFQQQHSDHNEPSQAEKKAA